jgi:hypothetical protein
MGFNSAIKALIEENTYNFFLIIEGYQEYFIIIHLYKQRSLFHKMLVRGPQGQNPRTTCGPRPTVWKRCARPTVILHAYYVSKPFRPAAFHSFLSFTYFQNVFSVMSTFVFSELVVRMVTGSLMAHALWFSLYWLNFSILLQPLASNLAST